MKKGQTNNPNGRPKGVPNKRTLDAAAIAEELGCDPFRVLLNFAKGDARALGYVTLDEETGTEIVGTIDPDQRLSAAKEAASYLYPKRKAIEHTGKDGEKLFNIEEFLKGNTNENETMDN